MAGMRIVRLSLPTVKKMMQVFSRCHPWDWAADIGEVPPRDSALRSLRTTVLSKAATFAKPLTPGSAVVVGPDGSILAEAEDGRSRTGNNPCVASIIAAMGRAGSTVNLRECAVIWATPSSTTKLDLVCLGDSSLGALELFKPPALIVARAPAAKTLELEMPILEKLSAVGTCVEYVNI
mmetsp:Transcript_30662/g.45674  ORF Transcript_30662/g.45674 Transcript_30662/m.45674 type:complete len:179 (+) Transcript_30662:1-537(+)